MGWCSDFVDMGFGKNAPAIWLYPAERLQVKVELDFRGDGFMTVSTPAYNQGWILNADARAPLPVIERVYDNRSAYTYLDYDGYRDGHFQTEQGWVVEQKDLLRWQRTKLAELGFRENEIDDVNYAYGRVLLMRKYPERFFLVYPQVRAVVDESVGLRIEPAPETICRLWLYFVPSNDPPAIAEPVLSPVVRSGFTAIELGFLTDAEMPGAAKTPLPTATARSAAGPSGRRCLTSPCYSSAAG